MAHQVIAKEPIKDFGWFDTILVRVKGTTSDIFKYFASLLITTGYADYQHQDGTTALSVDTWIDVPNNQAGPYTTEEFLPPGSTSLMDPATGYLDFSSLHLGDQVMIRNDFTVTPDDPNATVEARYVLGSGGGEYMLDIMSYTGRGASIAVPNPKGDIRISMSYEDTLNNPGKLQVRCSTTGTLVNNGSNIYVDHIKSSILK